MRPLDWGEAMKRFNLAACVLTLCGVLGGALPARAAVKGDFNGDGFADLAVGVSWEDVDSAQEAGAINVIYGSASGLASSGNQLWTQDSPGIKGVAATLDVFRATLASRR